MQLNDSIQRERNLTMRLIQSLQREAELTIELQGSMQPSNNEESLVVYREFAHAELQMIKQIEINEDANRKRELLQIENGPQSMQQSTGGGVYFAWSDCLNCMKIGATRRDSPLMRLREISSYTTTPFILIAWHPSPHPFRLEVAAHLYFREKRINARGSGAGTEFFHISAADALQWVAPLGPITLKRKHDISSVPSSHKRKRSNPEHASLLLANITEFVKNHLVFKAGYFVTTTIIHDSFIEIYHSDGSTFCERAFQMILKECVNSKFPDQDDVYASRETKLGKSLRGYVGIDITE